MYEEVKEIYRNFEVVRVILARDLNT
jgi:calcium/calmodulin-dependent protein kinase I